MILSAGALVLAINVLTSVVKRWIAPLGTLAVHIFAFALATVGALYFLYGGQYPGIVHLAQTGALIFSTAVAFYEVVLQHVSIFKNAPDNGNDL